jgi:hypothetical protein
VAARPTRGKVAICENILAMHSHVYGRRAQCGKVWPEPRLDLIKAHNFNTVATLFDNIVILFCTVHHTSLLLHPPPLAMLPKKGESQAAS